MKIVKSLLVRLTVLMINLWSREEALVQVDGVTVWRRSFLQRADAVNTECAGLPTQAFYAFAVLPVRACKRATDRGPARRTDRAGISNGLAHSHFCCRCTRPATCACASPQRWP